MKKFIQLIIFGRPNKGVKLPAPTLRRVDPPSRPGETEWAQEFKFGSRYGTRGSFYQSR